MVRAEVYILASRRRLPIYQYRYLSITPVQQRVRNHCLSITFIAFLHNFVFGIWNVLDDKVLNLFFFSSVNVQVIWCSCSSFFCELKYLRNGFACVGVKIDLSSLIKTPSSLKISKISRTFSRHVWYFSFSNLKMEP